MQYQKPTVINVDIRTECEVIMNDKKKILMAAAKAVGIVGNVTDYGIIIGWKDDLNNGDELPIYWNPLTSNDDCFRLETALLLPPRFVEEGVWSGFSSFESFAEHNGDKDKARRYASTQAAALIGKRDDR